MYLSSKAQTCGFEVSNQALRRVCGPYRVVCERWWEFRGSIRTQQVGSLELADISFSACTVVRDHRDEHYRGDQYFLVFQADGTARMRQRGSEATLRPGDCTLIDSRYPSVFETPNGFRQYSFHLPAQQFNERFGKRSLPLARTIPGDRGAGRLLSDVLASFVRNAPTLQGVDLTGMTLQLLSTALGLDEAPKADSSSERYAISPEEVAHYIDANIQYQELTPQHIADHFGISVRQLYRIVGVAGCTPAALIWKRRLEHAHTLLARSSSRTPIIEIALNCGFKDGAHFSRAYRKTFGHSPKVSRSAGLAIVSTGTGVNSGARRTKRVQTNAYAPISPNMIPNGI
jgi:AraC family transcriptional regulator, positive regulator of tynA and feaB